MSSEVYEVRMVTCSECNWNEKLVNFVPRTFYDFEVIFTLLFFHFIQALLSQPAKTVSSIQLLFLKKLHLRCLTEFWMRRGITRTQPLTTVTKLSVSLSLSVSLCLSLSLSLSLSQMFARILSLQLVCNKLVKNLELFQVLYKSYYFIPGINWKSWTLNHIKKEEHCDEKSNKCWRAFKFDACYCT